VLQGVAGCCRVLQGVAGCCRVLQWVLSQVKGALLKVKRDPVVLSKDIQEHGIGLFCCSVLQCVAECCSGSCPMSKEPSSRLKNILLCSQKMEKSMEWDSFVAGCCRVLLQGVAVGPVSCQKTPTQSEKRC